MCVRTEERKRTTKYVEHAWSEAGNTSGMGKCAVASHGSNQGYEALYMFWLCVFVSVCMSVPCQWLSCVVCVCVCVCGLMIIYRLRACFIYVYSPAGEKKQGKKICHRSSKNPQKGILALVTEHMVLYLCVFVPLCVSVLGEGGIRILYVESEESEATKARGCSKKARQAHTPHTTKHTPTTPLAASCSSKAHLYTLLHNYQGRARQAKCCAGSQSSIFMQSLSSSHPHTHTHAHTHTATQVASPQGSKEESRRGVYS